MEVLSARQWNMFSFPSESTLIISDLPRLPLKPLRRMKSRMRSLRGWRLGSFQIF